MNIAKALGRALMAPIMIEGGLNQIKSAEYIGGAVENTASKYGVAGQLPADGKTISKIAGTSMVASGIALGLGVLPQPAATVLAGQMVVTTLVGHAFWEHEGDERNNHKLQAFKNLAIAGGLLYAASTKK